MKQNTAYTYLAQDGAQNGKMHYKLYYKVELRPGLRISSIKYKFDDEEAYQPVSSKMRIEHLDGKEKLYILISYDRGYPNNFSDDSFFKIIVKDYHPQRVPEEFLVCLQIDEEGNASGRGSSTKKYSESD